MKPLRRRRGTFLILLVAGTVLFLGAAALVTDVGYAYVERQRTQGILDAAILATMATLDAGDPAEELVATRRLRKMLAANHVDPDRLIEVGFDRRRLGAALRAKAQVDTAAFLAAALGIREMKGQVGATGEGDLSAPPARPALPKGSLLDTCGGCPEEPKECPELRDLVGDYTQGEGDLESFVEGSTNGEQADGPNIIHRKTSGTWTFGGTDDSGRTSSAKRSRQARRIKELVRRITASPSPGCSGDGQPDESIPPRTTGPYGGIRLAP